MKTKRLTVRLTLPIMIVALILVVGATAVFAAASSTAESADGVKPLAQADATYISDDTAVQTGDAGVVESSTQSGATYISDDTVPQTGDAGVGESSVRNDIAFISEISMEQGEDAGAVGVGVKEIADGAGSEQVQMRGSLASQKGSSFAPQSLHEGETITISATWTPEDSVLQLGLKNEEDGVVTYYTVSGGAASASFIITSNGTFSIYVYNLSSVTVDLEISHIIT